MFPQAISPQNKELRLQVFKKVSVSKSIIVIQVESDNITLTELPPSCLGTRDINGSRCNNSSTEAGVLMAITDHGTIPPEGDTYYLWRTLEPPHKPSSNPRIIVNRVPLLCKVEPQYSFRFFKLVRKPPKRLKGLHPFVQKGYGSCERWL
ncbi:hypothetical protein AVEN_205543-1 [Araneus ventricosus]|uniref:Uncharacterized protein n=1 Tax=Araneus ventricosus TaxID=182803 RepID=A0A4Y2JQY2_ARAVE|nr:hypothetical protein AVEN_205543-1 [Araneus ventricosus]